MPAIAAMTLSTLDCGVAGLYTTDPVSTGGKTFSPEGFLPTGAARYVDRSGGIPAAYPSVTLSHRRPVQGNRNHKIAVTCQIPTLETLGTSSQSGYLPGQKVGYAGVARAEFVLPERMTLAERKALFALFVSTFMTQINASDASPASATASPVQAMIQDLETVY